MLRFPKLAVLAVSCVCAVVACKTPGRDAATDAQAGVASSYPEVESAPDTAHPMWSDKPPEDSTGRPRVLTPLSPATAYDVTDDTIVILQHGSCFGSCPVYSAGLRGDGSTYFYGEGHTQTSGFASGNVGRAAVASLVAFMRARDFLSLHTTYFAMATDHSKTIMILRQGGSLKYVEDDGSNDSEPRVAEIQDEIARVVGVARWVGSGISSVKGPTPKIPEADMTRMAGSRLEWVAKGCPTQGPKKTASIPVVIDQVGAAELGGGAFPIEMDLNCLRAKLPYVYFPLARVWNSSVSYTIGM